MPIITEMNRKEVLSCFGLKIRCSRCLISVHHEEIVLMITFISYQEAQKR